MTQWDWLTGRERLWWRIYRLRLLPGLLISLPFWFIICWYLLFAWANHEGHNKASKGKRPLTLSLFHLRLHDLMSRDWRRISQPDADKNSPLPTYQLFLSNEALDSLDGKGPPKEGKGQYEEGLVRGDKRYIKARFRYRGKKHWNWNYAQKSWKVRLDEELLHGQRTFSFINPVHPVPFGEEFILDVARDNNLLTPDYHPVRLFLNRAFMGIYYWMGQPDEWLIRSARRVPGSVYSGNGASINEEIGLSTLWYAPSAWKKPASRTALEQGNRFELEHLISSLQELGSVEFSAFAHEFLNLDLFARFDAIDVLFGGNQHDFDQDHKLYFDPYKGRWEPIAWDFRGFEHRPAVNRSENPLQLRLKELPGYLDMRNRHVWEMLHGPCKPAEVDWEIRRLAKERDPDFAADPYWDAYSQLPEISRYFRQMVRPLTPERFQAALDSMLGIYKKRIHYLQNQLSGASVSARLWGAGRRNLRIAVNGWNGVELERITVLGDGGEYIGPDRPADWRQWRIVADLNDDGVADPDEPSWETSRQIGEPLFPGTILTPRPEPNPSHGLVRLLPEERSYSFLITGSSGETPRQISLNFVNRVTSESFTLIADGGSGLGKADGTQAKSLLCDQLGPLAQVGRRSAHPWCYPRPESKRTVLGPGTVEVPETRLFGAHEQVVVLPGTTLSLGPDVSLFFFGKVTMEGTSGQPIRILPATSKPFGGMAIRGVATSGSRLAHVHISSGTIPKRSPSQFGGMINIHDTNDVTFSNSTLSSNSISDDILHVAYVKGLKLNNILLREASSDAVDLEFVEGEVKSLKVLGAGDECLDIMGSTVEVDGAVLAGCGGAGISAGEESDLSVRDSIIMVAQTGIHTKNNSHVKVRNMVIDRAGVGIRIESRQDRYEGLSTVEASALWLLRCRTDVRDKSDGLQWSSGSTSWSSELAESWPGWAGAADTQQALLQWLDGYWAGVAPFWVEPRHDEEYTGSDEEIEDE